MTKEETLGDKMILEWDTELFFAEDVKEFVKWLLEEQWDMDILIWQTFVHKVKQRAGKELL